MLRERDDQKEGVFLSDLFGTTPSGLKSSSGLSCMDQSMFSASEPYSQCSRQRTSKAF